MEEDMDEIEAGEAGEAIPAGIEVVQIAVCDSIVFGLATDGLVYRWDNIHGDWNLYSQ